MSSPSLSEPRWRERLTGSWAAAVALALFYVVLLLSGRDKSATVDEPGHLTAGYTYWKFGDYRLDPENGNLTQRWIALPLVPGDFKFPGTNTPAWRTGDILVLYDQWLYQMGNDAAAMLARGRAAAGLFAVALGFVVWRWSRRLFGPAGGMLSLALYVLNPTILANGALMTSDLASALFLLAALYFFQAMLRTFSPASVLASAAALGALFVVKMSAVIMVPVALTLALARVLDARPFELGSFRRLATRGQRALALGAAALVHVAVVALVVWTVHGFRYAAFAGGERDAARFPWEWVLDQPAPATLLKALPLEAAQRQRATDLLRARGVLEAGWSETAPSALPELRRTVLTPAQNQQLDALLAAPPPSLPARAIAFARRHRLLPEAYLYGFAHVWHYTGGRVAFLNGEVRLNDGWRGFFPYTFLVKTPLATLGIMVLALGAGWRRRGSIGEPAAVASVSTRFRGGETLPLLVFIGCYGVAAISSNINIGHRHILPVYPPLLILCGAAAAWFSASRRDRWCAGLAGAGLVTLALETACWFPNYLSYFNGLVRPARAYRHLIDSSLDWGQDLPALRRYLDERATPAPRYMALVGRGLRAAYYGIKATRLCNGIEPPLLILQGVSPQNDRARIDEFLRAHPEYDANIIGSLQLETGPGALLLKRASSLRLAGGTYFIGASLVQPLYPKAFGPWDAAHETTYQRLRALAQPLLADDARTRAAALPGRPPADWVKIFEDYDEFRFARLTARLRQREPNDNINYSILVYRLSDADVARALEGPSP